MAMVHDVRTDTAANCLRDFAGSLGVYPPRQPIPPWWEAFEQARGRDAYPPPRDTALEELADAIEAGTTPTVGWWQAFEVWRLQHAGSSTFVRTEAMLYEDEDDEEQSLAEDPGYLDYGEEDCDG